MVFAKSNSKISPIAIDFGASSVKLLQVTTDGQPEIVAAAELVIPDGMRPDPVARVNYVGAELPRLIKQAKFRGKRVVLAPPTSQTHVQHMQLMDIGGVTLEDQIKTQLQTQLGCAPDSVIVRALRVAEVERNGDRMIETICLAMARESVFRIIQSLRKAKLEVEGVHTDLTAVVRVFDHIHKRQADTDVATLYVDLGWGGTRAAIAHGRELVFARSIPIGGRELDQHLAAALHCDMVLARQNRLRLSDEMMPAAEPQVESHEGMAMFNAAAKMQHDESRGGASVTKAPSVLPKEIQGSSRLPDIPDEADLEEPLETIADELCMSMRYHQRLFPERSIDRVIFVGGEARQMWLCENIVRELRLPAHLGDPLVRFTKAEGALTPGLELGSPQPGWAVACGLCSASIDQ